MTRFFQTRLVRPAALTEPDSARYSQSTLQAQASDAVARREYLARYAVTTEAREVIE